MSSKWKQAIADYGAAISTDLSTILVEQDEGTSLYWNGDACTAINKSDATIDATIAGLQLAPDGWVPLPLPVKAEEASDE